MIGFQNHKPSIKMPNRIKNKGFEPELLISFDLTCHGSPKVGWLKAYSHRAICDCDLYLLGAAQRLVMSQSHCKKLALHLICFDKKNHSHSGTV